MVRRFDKMVTLRVARIIDGVAVSYRTAGVRNGTELPIRGVRASVAIGG